MKTEMSEDVLPHVSIQEYKGPKKPETARSSSSASITNKGKTLKMMMRRRMMNLKLRVIKFENTGEFTC